MKIIYYSETGNTKDMAELIKEGIESAGKTAEVIEVENAVAAELLKEEVLIFGCPAMGAEELDEQYMIPLMDEIGDAFAGKKVALFGSYGWGAGEWMEEWENKIRAYGAEFIQESLTVNESPEGEDSERCKAFGSALAK